MVMVEAMLGAGFSNCSDEYWHYSYGDSAWAVRVGETNCPYGLVFPPVALEPQGTNKMIALADYSVEQDRKGQTVRAVGSLEVFAANEEDGLSWRLGVRWASGVPITITIRAKRVEDLPGSLYLGDGEKSWEQLTNVQEGENLVVVQFTPALDRAVLTPVPRSVLDEASP